MVIHDASYFKRSEQDRISGQSQPENRTYNYNHNHNRNLSYPRRPVTLTESADTGAIGRQEGLWRTIEESERLHWIQRRHALAGLGIEESGAVCSRECLWIGE